MNTIGERLSFLIHRKGVKAYRVASETGISQATISRIINKNQKPNIATTKVLCAYFGVTEDWLLTGRGNTYKNEHPSEQNIIKEETVQYYTNIKDKFIEITPLDIVIYIMGNKKQLLKNDDFKLLIENLGKQVFEEKYTQKIEYLENLVETLVKKTGK